ncbi:MAG: bile acid:sodium symporter family protein [Bacteroidia bacterium]
MDNVSTAILAIALIIIMLGMGLSLLLEDFKRIIKFPKAVFIGLVNQLVLLPLLGFVLARSLSLPPEIAVGIMILAACPGGPTSNLITLLAKGDIALSVTLTAVSSLITIFTIPFVVNFALLHFNNNEIPLQLDIPKTIAQILIITVIPVSIGMLIRKRNEKFAIKMEKPVRKASAIVIVLVILGIVLKEKDNFLSYFQQAGIAAFLLNIGSMAIGFISSKLFKISDKQAISISIESGIQNGTLAITIAVVLLGTASFAIAPAVYSLIMFFTGGAAIFWGSQRKIKDKI